MSTNPRESVTSSSADGSGVAKSRVDGKKIRIRTIGWVDWRKLAKLFREIFPELQIVQISHYMRYYEDIIAVAEARGRIVGFYQFTPPGSARERPG